MWWPGTRGILGSMICQGRTCAGHVCEPIRHVPGTVLRLRLEVAFEGSPPTADTLHTHPPAGAHRTPGPATAVGRPPDSRHRATLLSTLAPQRAASQTPPMHRPGSWPNALLPRGSPGPGRRGSHCIWPTRLSEARERRPQHRSKSTCCSDQPLGRERKDMVSHQEGGAPCTPEATPCRSTRESYSHLTPSPARPAPAQRVPHTLLDAEIWGTSRPAVPHLAANDRKA